PNVWMRSIVRVRVPVRRMDQVLIHEVVERGRECTGIRTRIALDAGGEHMHSAVAKEEIDATGVQAREAEALTASGPCRWWRRARIGAVQVLTRTPLKAGGGGSGASGPDGCDVAHRVLLTHQYGVAAAIGNLLNGQECRKVAHVRAAHLAVDGIVASP